VAIALPLAACGARTAEGAPVLPRGADDRRTQKVRRLAVGDTSLDIQPSTSLPNATGTGIEPVTSSV
jgi:hypothetical protein